jgi:hypothetical protein
MMHQINERADYSAEFWSLIHLESELMAARAYLNVFGSLPEGGYDHSLLSGLAMNLPFMIWSPGSGIHRFIRMWPRQSVLWLHTLMHRTGRTDVSRPGMN